MKKLIFLLVLSTIFISSIVAAAQIKNVNGNEELPLKFKECTGLLSEKVIPQEHVNMTVSYINVINKKLPYEFQDVTIFVSSCQFKKESRKAVATFTKNKDGSRNYYIILANDKSDFKTVATILFHELGHIKQWQNNVSTNEYGSKVYDNEYVNFMIRQEWQHDLSEEFSEDYMMYGIKRYFPRLMQYSIKKSTTRPYNELLFKTFLMEHANKKWAPWLAHYDVNKVQRYNK
jgi:hypothetical protein